MSPHPWTNTMLLSMGRQTIDGLAATLNTVSVERGTTVPRTATTYSRRTPAPRA